MIAWTLNDPYWHWYEDGTLCGATIQSTGVLENLLRGLKKECPTCRALKSRQVELGL